MGNCGCLWRGRRAALVLTISHIPHPDHCTVSVDPSVAFLLEVCARVFTHPLSPHRHHHHFTRSLRRFQLTLLCSVTLSCFCIPLLRRIALPASSASHPLTSHRAFIRSSPRPISMCMLHMLPCFHITPIDLIVFEGSYFLSEWEPYSRGGFHA